MKLLINWDVSKWDADRAGWPQLQARPLHSEGLTFGLGEAAQSELLSH